MSVSVFRPVSYETLIGRVSDTLEHAITLAHMALAAATNHDEKREAGEQLAALIGARAARKKGR